MDLLLRAEGSLDVLGRSDGWMRIDYGGWWLLVWCVGGSRWFCGAVCGRLLSRHILKPTQPKVAKSLQKPK
jgi:hypothetical protein